MSKFQQIAIEIEKYIKENSLQKGEKLPIIDELKAKFGVSKSTIIKSLDMLERKGVVYQVRGSGTFFRGQKPRGFVSLLSNQGLTNNLNNYKITTEVIRFCTSKPTQEVAQHLNIGMDNELYCVKRIRYLNEEALSLEESFFNKSIVMYLNNEIVTGSIFRYIKNGLGLKLGFSDRYLHVDKLSAEEANYLGLEQGEPKLKVETIYHLKNGQPFVFSKINYSYKQSKFFLQTHNDSF